MPVHSLSQKVLLPELRSLGSRALNRGPIVVHAEKTSRQEVCPKCAQVATSVYDHRWVLVKDEPIRRRTTILRIKKRRFFCKPCGKPFTEPVHGIRKGARSTERYRRAVVWGCETFANLKAVRKHFRCSGGYVYDNLYPILERKQRERKYPWPKVIGIDEHSFKRSPETGFMRFATLLVDFKGKRVLDVVDGRTHAELRAALSDRPGRENVRHVALDMSDTYKSFAREFFPNAKLVADKFHVLRLLNPALNRRRRELTGPKKTPRLRRMLLKSGKRLNHVDAFWLQRWLDDAPVLKELYVYKEALHRLYRTRGYNRAARALTALTDNMAASQLPEIKKLRRTLIRWRNEILEYFRTQITNGRTEGFNNVAKLVKKRAYGYRSFRNYRLALLQACAK